MPAGVKNAGSSCCLASTKYLMRFYEFQTLKPQKPLTPAQARIKSLKDQAKRAQAAVKAERARQKILAAQNSLNQLESHPMSKTFRVFHKTNNPYSAWIAIGTYGSFNDALATALKKKKQGSIAIQIVDSAKMLVYSA